MNLASPVTIPIARSPGEPVEREVKTTVFQLIQWKHALSLESKGLTLSRGRKVSTHIKQLFGLKRTAKPEALRVMICQIIDDVTAQAEGRASAI